MDKPSITYASRSDTTPDTEISALGNVYRFVLDCHQRKGATRPGSPDDAERSLDDGARNIIQDTK